MLVAPPTTDGSVEGLQPPLRYMDRRPAPPLRHSRLRATVAYLARDEVVSRELLYWEEVLAVLCLAPPSSSSAAAATAAATPQGYQHPALESALRCLTILETIRRRELIHGAAAEAAVVWREAWHSRWTIVGRPCRQRQLHRWVRRFRAAQVRRQEDRETLMDVEATFRHGLVASEARAWCRMGLQHTARWEAAHRYRLATLQLCTAYMTQRLLISLKEAVCRTACCYGHVPAKLAKAVRLQEARLIPAPAARHVRDGVATAESTTAFGLLLHEEAHARGRLLSSLRASWLRLVIDEWEPRARRHVLEGAAADAARLQRALAGIEELHARRDVERYEAVYRSAALVACGFPPLGAEDEAAAPSVAEEENGGAAAVVVTVAENAVTPSPVGAEEL